MEEEKHCLNPPGNQREQFDSNVKNATIISSSTPTYMVTLGFSEFRDRRIILRLNRARPGQFSLPDFPFPQIKFLVEKFGIKLQQTRRLITLNCMQTDKMAKQTDKTNDQTTPFRPPHLNENQITNKPKKICKMSEEIYLTTMVSYIHSQIIWTSLQIEWKIHTYIVIHAYISVHEYFFQ